MIERVGVRPAKRRDGRGGRDAGRALASALFALACVAAAGCRGASGVAYRPVLREIAVTTVPLLVKESAATYPFLKADFSPGGVLEGKEVYAFVPSTITVVAGDTVHFTLVNPEDDLHTFVIPGLSVAMPGQQVTYATWVAGRAGVYPLVCAMPNHLPMMSGQVVVLAPAAVTEPAAAGH